MIRTALYIRVSTEEQALHGLSLSEQDADLTQYAQEHNLWIVDRYADEGITARKRYTKRPALLRLLDDIRAEKIDLVIFTKLDRWFRSIADYYQVQEILEEHGVNWKTIFENYDTSTAAGRLHINIMLSVAQDEADRTGERIRAVFANKVKNREFLTNRVTLGYQVIKKQVVIDEEKRPMVQAIFDHYEAYHSKYATCKYIAQIYDFPLNHQRLSRMIENPLYHGEYRGIMDFCEPYLTLERQRRLQSILHARNLGKQSIQRTYLFSGLIQCECGAKMTAAHQTQRHKYSPPTEYFYYRCNRHWSQHACPNPACIFEKSLEQYLLQQLKPSYDAYCIHYTLHQQSMQPPSPKNDLAKLHRKLKRLKDLYLDELIDKDTYQRDYLELQSQLNHIQLCTTPPSTTTPITAFFAESWQEQYNLLPAEDKRQFWRSILSAIVVNHEKHISPIFL